MTTSLQGASILLVIGGGVSAYKTLELVRRLKREGALARVVLTSAGQKFVTPLSLEALSGQKVRTDLFDLGAEAEMGHIQLSRSADLVVVAPATADLLAKMTHGSADDLASTLLLATDKRILAAPAMNVRMWLHPATCANVSLLRERGVLFVGPSDGEMACGEFGPGRMAEPEEILAAIGAALGGASISAAADRVLNGRKVVITSGPTYEPIDPVRYIANRSSGRQGHAIAAAAAAAGAQVVLVSGPVALPNPAGVDTRKVETAIEMAAAVEAALPADIFIGAAAVADWRVAKAETSKIKKGRRGPPILNLAENPDILANVAQAPAPRRPRLVVGFAAETDDLLANAARKLKKKGCDLIVANDVGAGSNVMGGPSNEVRLISRGGVEFWPSMEKEEVAHRLILRFADMLALEHAP